jgi:hypothetical protein
MEINLKKQYVCCNGKPIINKVNTKIFTEKYFVPCFDCAFCNDQCCSYGADYDTLYLNRIEKYANELENYIGISREEWFSPNLKEYNNYVGGLYRRTNTISNHCIFLDTQKRGCFLHRFCLEKGMDYRYLKSILCSLYPVDFYDDVLQQAVEVDDHDLICLNRSEVSLYRGVRNDLMYYFGNDFIEELDNLEREVLQIC